MPISTLIVDDEPLVRRSIVRALLEDPQISILGECSDGRSAIDAIRFRKPQLVFLDMHMPEMNGLNVISEIGPTNMPVTVFITAHQQYALDAFELGAIDYMLKPFGNENVARAVARAKQRLGSPDSGNIVARLKENLDRIGKQADYLERIAVNFRGRVILIDIHTIESFRADKNNVLLHVGQQQFDVRSTLSALEKKLDPRFFTRIHRSTIVNVKKIREVHPWTHGYHLVVLSGGQKLRMSRYQHALLQKLTGN
jgi:two-component system, LytTR family, response regulator